MSTRPFKSISPQELEAAIASAISAITNTETKVSVSGWKEADFEPIALIGKDKYELQLSLTVGKSYGESSIPPGMKTAFDTTSDKGEIPF